MNEKRRICASFFAARTKTNFVLEKNSYCFHSNIKVKEKNKRWELMKTKKL